MNIQKLISRFLMVCVVTLMLGAMRCMAVPMAVDLSAAFSYTNNQGQLINLPVVTTASTPTDITNKFLGLIRYFYEMGINGTISVPAGTWKINKTLYLNQYNTINSTTYVVNLVGAGQNQTIIEAAPGYEAIPLIMAGEYLQEPKNGNAFVDINALHHPQVSGVGIYDGTVTGTRYGLRTKSTPSGTLNDRGTWAGGVAYAVNDKVTDGTNTFVCTTAHTAVDGSGSLNKPYYGINWHNFWRQTAACASGYFVDSPLTVGPLDTTKPGQPTYLQNSDQFTLDVCVKNNESVGMDGQVCILTSGDLASSWRGTIWSLQSNSNGLYFTLNVPSGITNEGDTGTVIQARLGNQPGPGVHRITIQADFRDPQRQLAAWVDGIQVGVTVNGTTAASYQYPSGTRMQNYETGAFQIGTNYRGFPGLVDQDWTYCGLSISNAVRYQVRNIGDAQLLSGGGSPTDNGRYFTNDTNTVAFLPLDDAPPADTDYLNSSWKLVKVQHGYASTPSGNTPHYGYGWWSQPIAFYQQGPVVHDLTLHNPDTTYGAPFNMYLDYGADIQNVTIDGGFNGIDHWLEGANNYVMRLRNVTLQNAANSAIYSTGQAMFLCNGVTVQNGGRYPIYIRMCGADFTNLTLNAGPYTQYTMYVPCDQTQGITLNNITINADTTDHTPSQGVFNIGLACYGMCGPNGFYLNGCTAYHLPSGITFLALPNSMHGWEYPQGHIYVQNVDLTVDAGGKLASFISCTTPVWRGRISGCTANLNQYLSSWLDTGKWILPWHTSANSGYDIDDVVLHNGTPYRCIMNHSDTVYAGEVALHEPGVGTNWQAYWEVYPTSNLVFIHPDFTALPTSGYWTEGCHIVQIPAGLAWGDGHTYTEFRCTQSGDAGIPGSHPKWAPVITNAPTVSITSPTPGTYLPGCTLTLTALASDSDGYISKVDFYQNGTFLANGTAAGSGYTYTWSNVPAGIYNLTAKAYDNNATSTVSSAVNVTVANVPTSGMLLWLAADNIAGKNNGDPITTWADSSGNGRNAVSIGGDAPTYNTNVFNGKPVVRFNGNSLLQVNSLPLGPYSIAAVFKTTTNSELVYEHSDNTLSNSNGSFLYTSTNSTVSVKRGGAQTGKDIMGSNASNWAASYGVAIMTLDQFDGTDAGENLFVNSSQQWLNQTYTGNINTTAVTTDHFNIGMRAQYGNCQFHGDIAEIIVYDHVLNSTERAQLNTVLMGKYALDVPPTVSITAPANNASFTTPANITLTASASDSDGSISKVEFYNGITLLGTASSSPYSYTWNGVGVGNYTITAIAYDNHNLTTVSSPVNITVTTLPTTGMLLWLKADALSLNNNDPVNTWTDVSGNGRDAVFTQVGGVGVPPVYTTNVFNGKPVVRFNGNSLLQVSALPLGAYTIATVFKTTSNTEIVYEHSDDFNFHQNASFLFTSTNNTITVKRAGVQTGKDMIGPGAGSWAANRAAPMMTVDQFGGTDASETLAINNSLQPLNQTYTGNLNNTTVTTDHFNIGERASYGTLQFHGDIAEIVVYDHVLSSADMTTLNNAMTSKYALNAPPAVSLTAPTPGQVFTAPANITLTATASDSDGTVSKVEFYNGYTLLGTASSSPYSYAWNGVPAGSYTLTALAYDNLGFTTVSSAAAITVDTPPTVSLTAPAANTNYIAPASVALTATASDSDGTISKVEFYQGSTLVGTVSTSPYNFTWTNVVMGNYSLTAKAYDNNNIATTSSAVNIIVWGTSDIGSVGVSGSASYSGGTFTVSGAGAGVTSTADAFRFVYRQFSGNTTIVARVATAASATTAERAGVMMRQNLNANSIEASAMYKPTSTYYVYFLRRTSAGGSTSSTTSSTAAAPPYWVKVVRSSNTLSAFMSANGSSWTAVGSGTTVTMTDPIYVGLAVTSGSTSAAKTVTFDNVSITQP